MRHGKFAIGSRFNNDISVRLRKSLRFTSRSQSGRSGNGGRTAPFHCSYSAKELKAAGYTANELRDFLCTAKELKDAGYTLEALRDAGYTAKALKDAAEALTDGHQEEGRSVQAFGGLRFL